MAFRLPDGLNERSTHLFEKAVEVYLDKWISKYPELIDLRADLTSNSSTVFDLICDRAISPKLYKKALALGAKPKVFINYLKNRMFFKRIVLQELLRIYK